MEGPPATPAEERSAFRSVGLAHDYLLVPRGAERCFAGIASLFPDAPVYTLLHDPEVLAEAFDGRLMRTSALQRLGLKQDGFRKLLPLYPYAASRLDAREHDLVVSSSSAFAHGLRTSPDAVHVCYCYTPFRYAWHERDHALAEVPAAARPVLRWLLDWIRAWDLGAAQGVTHYIAISELSRERIRECYGRESTVVHPPVAVQRFAPASPGDSLLFVGELVRHKRVEVALLAAERAGMRIRVVGTGPDLERLRARHGDHAEFLGRLDDEELAVELSRALAVVVPNIEEFGIVAVEAQAAGRPVIATRGGGVKETVVDGETGILVDGGSVEGFAAAMSSRDLRGFQPDRARASAERFSSETFAARLTAEIERLTGRACSAC